MSYIYENLKLTKEVSNNIKTNIDRLTANASVTHMSNAKWRKLFGILSCPSLKIMQLKWKFLADDRISLNWGVPRPETFLKDRFGDYLPYPYGQFKEIEWVEIPNTYRNPKSISKRPLPNLPHDLIPIRKAIEQRGNFPLQVSDSGLRIIGYTW